MGTTTQGPPAEEPAEVGKDGLPVRVFADQDAWEAWLAAHGGTERGLWMKVAKKGSGCTSASAAQAVEGALCHGWVDGQLGRWDESWYLVRFTPRGPRSAWSRINVETVERLVEQGRMAPAGLAAVERARAGGTWERAYDPPSRATVPADLQDALDADPAAASAFAALDAANRYSVLYRVQTASPRNRARRVGDLVAMLARGERHHP